MKKILIWVGLIVFCLVFWGLIIKAFAETTAIQAGSTTFYSGDNNGTAIQSGNTTFYNVNGESGVAIKSGSTTFYSGDLFKDK